MVQGDVLAAWDTTTITDGVYHIKLVVTKVGDHRNEVVVENIQVSNYSRAPGQNEMSVNTQTEKRSVAVEIRAPVSTVIEKKVNPASIRRQEIQRTVIFAILAVFVALSSIATYSAIQSRRRR